MPLHHDEVPVSPDDVRRLLAAQAPRWADLSLVPAGEGTDNRMFRLGEQLVVRMPRRPGSAADIAKEQTWLPRLAPHLPLPIPEPVLAGAPDAEYPFAWAVYRWIEGVEPDAESVTDWAAFGRDLAGFVEALHRIDLQGARPAGSLSWYRGEPLACFLDDGLEALAQIRTLDAREPLGLDLDAVESLWRDLAARPQAAAERVWLHGDLRAANLVARDGRLAAVIDFGTLNVGLPAAEHKAGWSLPQEGRRAYRERLGLDDDAWALARGWQLLPQLTGVPFYWDSWPDFAHDCLEGIREVLAAED